MSGYYDRDRSLAAGSFHNHGGTFIGNTAEYMVSGWPYAKTVTSTTTITFNAVTQWINVSAVGGNVEVTFQGGTSKFVVPTGTQTGQLDLKCTEVTLTLAAGSASIMAGLTNVKSNQMPDISEYAGIK